MKLFTSTESLVPTRAGHDIFYRYYMSVEVNNLALHKHKSQSSNWPLTYDFLFCNHIITPILHISLVRFGLNKHDALSTYAEAGLSHKKVKRAGNIYA